MQEQRLSSLVSLICCGAAKDPFPWQSTRNLRAYFGGRITLDNILATDESDIAKQLVVSPARPS